MSDPIRELFRFPTSDSPESYDVGWAILHYPR